MAQTSGALPSRRWFRRASSDVAILLVGIAAFAPLTAEARTSNAPNTMQPVLGSRAVPIITVDGLRFRDLNRNGRLDPYEDWRLPPAVRAHDLVSRMSLHEKAGTMMHGTLPAMGSLQLGLSAQGYALPQATQMIVDGAITTFLTRLAAAPRVMAEQSNAVQEIAERTRLGIPLTISTDPRSHFQSLIGASVDAHGFSQWPETLGFAALRDPARVRAFADIARREYRAVGIQEALSPQADLATEPRWARGTGTFGSDPQLAKAMVAGYVAGFQGSTEGPTRDGVLAVVKHWVGYGAEIAGWDAHNYYGRFVKLDNASFAKHIIPFEGAFAVHVGAVMPTYAIVEGVTLDGKPLEQVGAGFNKQLITNLLRDKYHFDGIVLSDWAITDDCDAECSAPTHAGPPHLGMPWGVEALSKQDRFIKAINAGIDQIGGAHETELVEAAVNAGKISPARVDAAVTRILASKFELGLFENPFVDPDQAAARVGNESDVADGIRAQAESQVLLKNQGNLLPLAAGQTVYLVGVDPAKARAHGLVVVDDPARARAALVRMATPFERLHPNYFIGGRQHEGALDFRPGNPDLATLNQLAGKTRVIGAIFLDRPAILTNVIGLADAMLGNFGASDDALLDVVTGRVAAKGRLPFELPSSMAAVEKQDSAAPDDSEKPLFPFGAGIVR